MSRFRRGGGGEYVKFLDAVVSHNAQCGGQSIGIPLLVVVSMLRFVTFLAILGPGQSACPALTGSILCGPPTGCHAISFRPSEKILQQ